ncbi:MAG: hypothetical protein GF311_10525 [Candidatus Lokiarchaeota archaeon]|nr:hypothetical protein [Candidatus Lokiarchaeota archaeon]
MTNEIDKFLDQLIAPYTSKELNQVKEQHQVENPGKTMRFFISEDYWHLLWKIEAFVLILINGIIIILFTSKFSFMNLNFKDVIIPILIFNFMALSIAIFFFLLLLIHRGRVLEVNYLPNIKEKSPEGRP